MTVALLRKVIRFLSKPSKLYETPEEWYARNLREYLDHHNFRIKE